MRVLILISMLFVSNSFAKSREAIFCHTARFSKSFVVNKEKVVFVKKVSESKNREIASIPAVRSKKLLNGFVKELSFEGQKYRINIENTEKFSELDDYMSIRSRKGHEITYSLSCENV